MLRRLRRCDGARTYRGVTPAAPPPRQGPLDDLDDDDDMFEQRKGLLATFGKLKKQAGKAASLAGHKHLAKLLMDEDSVTKVRHGAARGARRGSRGTPRPM